MELYPYILEQWYDLESWMKSCSQYDMIVIQAISSTSFMLQSLDSLIIWWVEIQIAYDNSVSKMHLW